MNATTTTRPRTFDFSSTTAGRHVLIPRLLAAMPLLGIGLMHVFVEGLGMRPLVEAAGLPAPALLAPLAIAAELIAGLSLLLAAWARLGAVLAIVTMAVAVYAHIVIDVWPNAEGEPPLALPIVVAGCATYVLWRGAGRWSLDARERV